MQRALLGVLVGGHPEAVIVLPDIPRFWLPDGEPLSFSDRGFIPDPEGRVSGAWIPAARRFESLRDVSCLLLVGEPGLGKTTALRREHDRLVAGGERTLMADLGLTTDSRRLYDKVFNGPDREAWEQDDSVLHLFLDSLDFALVRIEDVVELLCEGLDDLPVDRLKLRIGCRSAERPADLVSWLRRKFGPDDCQIHELLPLRLKDVHASATAALTDPDAFVSDVIKHGLQPLAMTPMTLRMLLDSAAGGALPRSRRALYESGCRALCAETDPSRQRARERRARLTASERLAVAGRIAGMLTLSAGPPVDLDAPESFEQATAVADLAGGVEINTDLAAPTEFRVGEAEIADALGSALFAHAGSNRLHFAHQTYGEFLAGRWLAASDLSPVQLTDLLFAATDDGLRVIPQLRATASWLATHSPSFAEVLAEHDPAVMIRADLSTTLVDERELIVDALLRAVSSYEIGRFDVPVRSALEHLNHGNLEQQLRPVLTDRTVRGIASREVAMDIAATCKVAGLEPDLLAIALDPAEPIRAREAAVVALGKVASEKTLAELVPLAVNPLAEDEDDELKGAALSILWPRVLSTAQVLAAVTPAKRTSLWGHYKQFIRSTFVPGIEVGDLPDAVRAALAWPNPQMHPMDPLADAREQLLIRAAGHVGDGAVADALAELVADTVSGYGDVVSNSAMHDDGDPFGDESVRRSVVERLVETTTTIEPAVLAMSSPPLVRHDDVDWLVERLIGSVGTATEAGWADLAEIFTYSDGRVDDRIYDAAEQSPVLGGLIGPRFEAVKIDSSEADQMRDLHAKQMRLKDAREQRSAIGFDVQERVISAIELWQQGDKDGYWAVLGWMEKAGRGDRGFVASDPRRLAGWDLVDESSRQFVRDTALDYLRMGSAVPEEWFGLNRTSLPAWGGYRALRLLKEERPEVVEAADNELWERWAPVIVGWPRDGDEESAFNRWAIDQLVARCPSVAAAWFNKALQAEFARDGSGYSARRFEHVEDDEIRGVLLAWAKKRTLTPEQRAGLLDPLIRTGSQEARDHAQRLVTKSAISAGGTRLDLAVRAAALLVTRLPDASWTRIWPLIEHSDDFGRRLAAVLAEEHEIAIAPRLTVAQVVELYTWLERRYPHREDPDEQEPHWVGPREQIGRWRDGLLTDLGLRGTAEAVRAFDVLYERFPELVFLKALRVRAADLARRAEWTPPAPARILQMTQDAGRRWITSESGLHQAVLAALEEFQQRLGGLNPQAHVLWDTARSTPKHEQEIGSVIAEFLRDRLSDRGVFLAREPEARLSKSGKGRGDSIDIWIEALIGKQTAGARHATCIIELKGSWNRELMTAMDDQLVTRYLDPPLHRHGIYLVAYFGRDRWDRQADKTRYSDAGTTTIDELRRALDDQSKDLALQRDVELTAVVLDCSLPS